ncbi:MAG: hypothetical protein JRN20_05285 [Nitrososphaerota archaeon]|nr:hypothetical protein [Nitrososphaerota archaeon]
MRLSKQVEASSKEKTVSHSFRVNEEALRKIMEDARTENVSVNTFVNQLLMTYSNFDRLVHPFGMIKITLPTFRRILNSSSEKGAEETGKWAGTNVSKAFQIADYGAISLATVREYFKTWAVNGGFFQYNERIIGNKLIVTFNHELGRNGTNFLKGYAMSAFRGADIEIKPTSSTEGSISFEIPSQISLS